MQNGDKALPSISPEGRGLMLILEPHGILSKCCIPIKFNIV